MTPTIRIKITTKQPGPDFHAEAGEERSVLRDLGLALIAAGEAKLIADPWPAVASGSGSRSDPAERPSKQSSRRKR